jgi:predicted RNA binding protein YcfA (HicA-like mRNA interferase family)
MKIRELKTLLHRRGYRVRPGKGSHFIWTHPAQPDKPIVLHGADSEDARPWQIARVCKGQRYHRSASLVPHQKHARH